MSNHFDIEEYQQFIKEAYKMADVIHIELDSIIKSLSDISSGKFASLCNSVIDIKEEIDNGHPYTYLVLQKSYSVYEYFMKLDNWEEFSSMDEESEMSIWSVAFVKNGEPIAAILSNYRAYNDIFYFIND